MRTGASGLCPPQSCCHICASDDIRGLEADMVMLESYSSVNVEEDPCNFTSCGHAITLSTMDGMIEVSKHYELDGTRNALSKTVTLEAYSSHGLPTCPSCRSPLRDIARLHSTSALEHSHHGRTLSMIVWLADCRQSIVRFIQTIVPNWTLQMSLTYGYRFPERLGTATLS